MASVASAAPEVLIARAAAHTTRLRVGSGGVMLPTTRRCAWPRPFAPSGAASRPHRPRPRPRTGSRRGNKLRAARRRRRVLPSCSPNCSTWAGTTCCRPGIPGGNCAPCPTTHRCRRSRLLVERRERAWPGSRACRLFVCEPLPARRQRAGIRRLPRSLPAPSADFPGRTRHVGVAATSAPTPEAEAERLANPAWNSLGAHPAAASSRRCRASTKPAMTRF